MTKVLTFLVLVLVGSTAYAGNYNYSYAHNNEVVEIIEKRIQVDPRYFLGTEGLYAVGDGIAEEKQEITNTELEVLKAENAKLQAQLDLIIKLLTKGGVNPGPGPGDVEPEPEPEPLPPPVDSLEQKVFNVFKAKCYTCHKNEANGLNLFNEDFTGVSDKLTLNDIVNIHHRTEGIVLDDGETLMPKGGKPLTAEEMKWIKKWMYQSSL
jgi:hypothetical protein